MNLDQLEPNRVYRRVRIFGLIVVVAVLVLSVGAVIVQAQARALGPVFALRGTLGRAVAQPYDTVLTTVDQVQIGLVGQTPAVEAEIVRLRNRVPVLVVKVWGVRYASSTSTGLDVIVVESILDGDADEPPTPFPPIATSTGTTTSTPTPTNSPTPTWTPPPTWTPDRTAMPAPTEMPTPTAMPTPSAPTAEVAVPAANVRSGPSTDYEIVGRLGAGDTCLVLGRNADSTWYLLTCGDGPTGWVFGELLNLTGNTVMLPAIRVAPPPTPTPTPTVPPTPTPVFSGWKSSYFANRDLRGDPVLVVDSPSLDFDWGGGSPGAGVPVDNFSARYERRLTFPRGLYTIQVTVDDGVRLFLDDRLIIDQWTIGSVRTYTSQQLLDGAHNFRVEYFEAGGMARIRLDVTLVSNTPAWRATYFDNPNLAGSPRVVRDEPRTGTYPLNYDWMTGSPAPGRIPEDRWSARWTGTFYFEGGDYRFNANADDGVRVYIDGILVLDDWRDGYREGINNTFRNLGRGDHEITVEYYENRGGALIRVWWDRIEPTGGRLRTE